MKEWQRSWARKRRKYPGLSRSEINFKNTAGRLKRGGDSHFLRHCVVCGCDASGTYWKRKPGLRMDGQPYSLHPVWHKSTVVPHGGWECDKDYKRSYYQKNKDRINRLAREKRLREKRLKDFKMKSLGRITKAGKKQKL